MEQIIPWIATTLLVQLVILVFIMQIVRQIKRNGSAVQAVPQLAAPESPPASPPAPILNRGELVAAIAAAIAETMGTDVRALRIHSIQKI